MQISIRRSLLGSVVFSAAMLAVSQAALANGQGTPVETPPPPVMPAPEPAPAPAPMMPEPMAPNWSGMYVGGSLGYGFMANGDNETLLFDRDLNGTFGDTVTTAAGANAFSPGFCNGKPNGNSAAAGCDEDDDGGIDVGVRLGYDWQSGSFVYGALLEAAYVDIEDNVTGFSTTPAAYKFVRDLNFLGAARLRAGFTTGDFLIYATGGAAYGDIQHTFATTNGVNSFTPGKDDGQWGYQIGGGAEMKLNANMSLGVEYLFTSLNDDEYAVAVGPGTAPATNPFLLGNPAGTDMIRSEDKLELHQVRAVLNYHFGE